MTNTAIILGQMELLIADGVITADNEIHTYAHWGSLGYVVDKGQTHIAKFPIWKYRDGKKVKTEEDEEKAQSSGRCFMQTAYWFSDKQVITKEEYLKKYGKLPKYFKK